MSDYILPTLAGPEIGVASTKAFTSQLAVLALLSLHIKKYTMQNVDYANDIIFQSLFEIQQNMERILKNSKNHLKLQEKSTPTTPSPSSINTN